MTGWSPAGPVTPKLPIKGWWATVQNNSIDPYDWSVRTNLNFTSSVGGNGRWEVTVDPATNLYTVYKNGAQVLTFNYASQEGASWRHCGAGVSRGTFIDSGEWDDLTMMDIV